MTRKLSYKKRCEQAIDDSHKAVSVVRDISKIIATTLEGAQRESLLEPMHDLLWAVNNIHRNICEECWKVE